MSDKPNGVPTPADFFGWLGQVVTLPATLAANAAAAVTGQVTGHNQTNADPLTLWKDMAEKNQEAWVKFMQQVVATPEFAKGLGRSTSATAQYRTLIRQTAKVYMEAAGMPTMEDVSRVAEQVVAVDAKLDDLTDTVVDNLSSTPQVLGKIVATLENLAGRLDKLEASIPTREELKAVSERLEALEARTPSREELTGQLSALENKTPSKEELNGIGERLGGLEASSAKQEDLNGIRDWLMALENKLIGRDEINALTGKLEALEGRAANHDEINSLRDWLMALENKVLSRDDLNNVIERLGGLEGRAVSRDDFNQIWPRFETIEGRIPGEETLNRLSERLGALEEKTAGREEIDGLNQRLGQLEGQLGQVADQLQKNLPAVPTPAPELEPAPAGELKEVIPAQEAASKPKRSGSRAKKASQPEQS